jgi:uncharacterized repeat protein (TIGR03803 family)
MTESRGNIAFALAVGLFLAIPAGEAHSRGSSSAGAAIYSFGTQKPVDGAVPKGSLTDANGLLFGRTTTLTPGSGDGVIFHINPNGTGYTIDHSFAGPPDDGENPRHDAMTLVNGVLYGTTLQGGSHNTGTIFSIAQDGSSYQVLTSLHKSIGDEPHSCFVVVGGVLYGMTADGGDNHDGVIFSFDPAMSTYQVIYSFAKSTGSEPHGRLTLDPDGTTLYGMTRKGGSSGFGVVFSIDTTGHHYQVLHSFEGGTSDGATSDHGYVVQSGKWLYGMTTNGGPANDGVIFALTSDGSKFQLLHGFGSSHHDGKNPYGSLLLVGNSLYGTTARGGAGKMGTVFVINTVGSGYQRLWDFTGSHTDGARPIDNVILVGGALYGLTTEGGAFDQGTIFKIPLE